MRSKPEEHHQRIGPAQLTQVSDAEPPDALVGESDVFRRMMDKIHRYAEHDDIPVLLEGETGTGKTMLAQYLHRLSRRAQRPFIRIELGRVDDGLAAAELHGYRRGAFTGAVEDRPGPFAAAHGGSVFLDELQNVSAAQQRCLLRIVDEGEVQQVGAVRSVRVDVRIISATNVPLSQLLEEHTIRSDLAERIAACPIRVPPLREHLQDIPLLVRHYIARFWKPVGHRTAPEMQPELMAALTHHQWPGNIRSLRHVVRRLLIEALPDATVTFEHCRDDLAFLRTTCVEMPPATPADARRARGQCKTATEAARRIGVSRTQFYRLLKQPGDDAEASA